MYKSIIAGMTALSLCFATAGPAQANGFDREDAGKLIIGLAAIAALNAALENRRRNDDTPAPVVDRNHGHQNGGHWNPRPNRARFELPADCLQQAESRGGDYRMFMQPCLARNQVAVSDLPRRCEVRVFTNDGPRNGFDPSCMHDEGYYTDRRR